MSRLTAAAPNASGTVAPAPAPAAEAARLSAVWGALVALAPRIATAGAYLAAWIVPEWLPPGLARALLVGLILEFLLLHSYPFLNFLLGAEKGASFRQRAGAALGVLGFGVFYLVMAGALGWATQSMTPLWTILWLLGSRIFEVAVAREPGSEAAQSRTAAWLRNLCLYLLLIVLTAIVPLPAFSLTPAIVASFHLPGSGDWIEQPQHALAFGFLYFGLGAYFDLRARLRRA